MAKNLTCPDCGTLVRIPEGSSRETVTCPACDTVIPLKVGGPGKSKGRKTSSRQGEPPPSRHRRLVEEDEPQAKKTGKKNRSQKEKASLQPWHVLAASFAVLAIVLVVILFILQPWANETADPLAQN